MIVGSGSSIPVYLYQAWTSKFNAGNDHVQVRYMPLGGTTESIRQIKVGIGDFGGGEILLTDEEMRDSKIGIMIPMVLVGIVPIYNVPGNPELNWRAARGNLPWNREELEGSANCAVEPECRITRSTHFCRIPQSGQGIELHLHRILVKDQSSLPRRSGQEFIAAMAIGIGGRSRTGHGEESCGDAGRYRLRRRDFRSRLSPWLWPGSECRRALRAGDAGHY